MPLSTEKIQNKPLSGTELAEIIVQDVRDMLTRDGLFSSYVGYGRVAYDVTVRVHTGNPMYPEHETQTRAKVDPGKGIEGRTPLQGPVEKGAKMDTTRSRKIDSPNLNRIHADLPITVTKVNGMQLATQEVRYDKRDYPEPEAPTDTNNLPPTESE